MKIREKDLRRALQRREMVLHYQPIVGLKSARIVAVEALLRWPLPSGRVLAPGEFIPVAERTRLILPLGTWVLRQACLQTRVWQTRHPRHAPVTISVNMSARQFLLGDQVGVIAQALDVSGLAPEYLRLEITESSVLEHSTKSLAQLRALEQMGVQIAIDDFGTGYSSLSRLNAFPVSQLKIDRSFVGAIGDEQSAKPLVLATIQLAHSLGLKAVAEGVETSEQWSFLRRNGCEEAQGYMLSRPVPAEIIDQLLAADAPLTRARGDHLGLRLPASLTTRAVAGVAAAALATGWVSAAAAGAPATALASQVAASLGDHTAGLVTLPPATVPPVKDTARTSWCDASASAVSRSPVTTVNISVGQPAS